MQTEFIARRCSNLKAVERRAVMAGFRRRRHHLERGGAAVGAGGSWPWTSIRRFARFASPTVAMLVTLSTRLRH